MYLLGTNICAYLMKGRYPAPNRKIPTAPASKLAISFVTLFQLEYGAAKANWGIQRMDYMRLFLSAFQVLPLTDYDAVVSGKIRAQPEKQVRQLPETSLLSRTTPAYSAEFSTSNWKTVSYRPSLFVPSLLSAWERCRRSSPGMLFRRSRNQHPGADQALPAELQHLIRPMTNLQLCAVAAAQREVIHGHDQSGSDCQPSVKTTGILRRNIRFHHALI